MIVLPESPAFFADATWSDIAPFYEALAVAPLSTPPDDAQVEEWLGLWSRLDMLVGEAGTLAMIAYTANTADEASVPAILNRDLSNT